MTITIESQDIKIQEVVDLIIYFQNLNIEYTITITTREDEEKIREENEQQVLNTSSTRIHLV